MTERTGRPRSDEHRSVGEGECEDRAKLDDIFNAGRDARLDGKALDDNPYAAGSDERKEWRAGWCATVEIDDDGETGSGYQKN